MKKSNIKILIVLVIVSVFWASNAYGILSTEAMIDRCIVEIEKRTVPLNNEITNLKIRIGQLEKENETLMGGGNVATDGNLIVITKRLDTIESIVKSFQEQMIKMQILLLDFLKSFTGKKL